MVDGRVTGMAGGAVVGWIAAGGGELEAVADGEGVFARTRAAPGGDGRLAFAIPVPDRFRDGRIGSWTCGRRARKRRWPGGR
ncbi:MAG: hypothetical protein WDM92_06065 [Caulobacteraceae bacterium]